MRAHGIECRGDGVGDGLHLNVIEAIWHVSAAARRRQTDLIARAARQVHAKHAVAVAERAVATRIRRAEQRDDRRADGCGQMHRSGVSGQQDVETAKERGEIDEV